MKKELIYVLETMDNPKTIQKFLSSMTLDERETISQLLSYVNIDIKNKWEQHL